jgi:hypothetical protein
MRRYLQGVVTLGAALAVSLLAPTARAACGDFGALGIMLGGLGGAIVTIPAGFTFPLIARAANPRLKYWPGVGWTMLGGAAGTIGGMVASRDCPHPESLFLPSAIGLPSAAAATTIWGFASAPTDAEHVSLFVTTPRYGRGALLGLGGRL